MFTIKLYQTGDGSYRQKILTALSFTILKNGDGKFEITLHQKDQSDDRRYDIAPAEGREAGWPDCFDTAIIENSAGKTTEVLRLHHPV